MDPITLIVSALALGAAAGIKDTTAQSIKGLFRNTCKNLP